MMEVEEAELQELLFGRSDAVVKQQIQELECGVHGIPWARKWSIFHNELVVIAFVKRGNSFLWFGTLVRESLVGGQARYGN